VRDGAVEMGPQHRSKDAVLKKDTPAPAVDGYTLKRPLVERRFGHDGAALTAT